MSIGSTGNHLLPVINAVMLVMMLGLLLSGYGLVFNSVKKWLSRYTHIEDPDPTEFKRPFVKFYDRVFAPAGSATANGIRSPVVSQVSYLLSVGVAVLLFGTVTYLATAGLMVGTAVASYHTLGVTMDLVPTYRMIVAFVVVLGMAVMFHAEDRAKELYV